MWDFFQKIGPVWTGVLILTTSGFIFTLWTFWGTVERYSFLVKNRLNGNRKRYALRQVRHEGFRVCGHLMCIMGVCLSAYLITTTWYPPLPEEARRILRYRDLLFLGISFKMTWNSILDLVDRRKGYRGFLLAKKPRTENALANDHLLTDALDRDDVESTDNADHS